VIDSVAAVSWSVAGDDETIPQTPSAAAASKLTPQLPKRYRVGEVIGEGGMGRVYRAHDTTLGRDVAIKVIETDLPGPDKTIQRERFVREAKAAARLVHPNIAMVHDVDPDAGWLVMELVEGESLRDVAQRGPLAPPLVRAIAGPGRPPPPTASSTATSSLRTSSSARISG